MARFHKPDKQVKGLRLQQVELFESGFSIQEGWVHAGLSRSRFEKAASSDQARIACEAYLAQLRKGGWKRVEVESPLTKLGDKRRYTFREAFFEIELVEPTLFRTSTGWIGEPANGGNVFTASDPVHAVWWAESVIAERLSMGYQLDAPKRKQKKPVKKPPAKKQKPPPAKKPPTRKSKSKPTKKRSPK